MIWSPDFSIERRVGHDSTYKPMSKRCMRAARSGERVDQDVFVVGVGAGAAGAQAVQGWDSQSRREVAVATAAGGSLGQLEAQACRAGELRGLSRRGTRWLRSAPSEAG